MSTAFDVVYSLSEPVLVLVISNTQTDLDGLSVGATKAVMSKHRILIAALPDAGTSMPPDLLAELEE